MKTINPKTFYIIVGILIIACYIVPYIVVKLDTTTPEQKKQIEAGLHVLKQFEPLRDYPSMKVDGKIVRIDIDWYPDKAIIILPKTYGFISTRFAQRAVSISQNDFNRGEIYGDHLFIGIDVQVYSGPTPVWTSQIVAIPNHLIPELFRTINKGIEKRK